MRKKSVSVGGAIVVAVSIAATLAVPDRHVPLGAMTASYVGDGFFWLTNTTDRTLVAQLWYIEIQDGTNWIEWGTHNHQVELKPLSGALDAGLPLNVSPPTNNWRLRGIVGEKLEGFAEVKTAIRCYPNMISYRVRTGDTNVPLHPFPKGGSFYGGHREFVTAAAVGALK
jgi:hypothetical protein